MSANFAGSRSVDERRRRRLAADSDESRAPETATSRPVAKDAGKAAALRSASRFPLRKLISPRLWKLWGVAMLGLAVGVAVVWASVHYANYADVMGPGFARMFNPGSGRAMDCCLGLTFLLTGQLALLIWWVRSRSPEDFAGSYRTWTWMAAGSFLAAFSALTDGHIAASETVLWMAPLEFANAPLISWMGPAFLCGVVIVWGVRRDMRGCKSSVALLWISAASWASAAVVALREPLPALSAEWNVGLAPALVMFASLCLFTSLLLHARHVIYETADPPASPKSKATASSGRFNLFALFKRSSGDAEQNGKSSAKRAAERKTAAPAKSKAAAPGDSKSPTAAKSGAPAPKFVSQSSSPSMRQKQPEAALAPQSDAKSAALQVAKKQDGGAKLRVDVARDKSSLKGLSKRERKLVRKGWRDQERNTREDRDEDE